ARTPATPMAALAARVPFMAGNDLTFDGPGSLEPTNGRTGCHASGLRRGLRPGAPHTLTGASSEGAGRAGGECGSGRSGRVQMWGPAAFARLVTARVPDGGSVHVPRHVRARRGMRELLRRPSLPDLGGGATAIETRLGDRLLTPVPGSGL